MPSGRPAGRSTAPSGATDGPGTPGRRGREPALWRPTRRRRRQRRSGGRRRDRTAPARGALPGSGRHGPAGIWAAPPEDGAWRVGRDLQPQERREGFVITANAVETAETPKTHAGRWERPTCVTDSCRRWQRATRDGEVAAGTPLVWQSVWRRGR